MSRSTRLTDGPELGEAEVLGHIVPCQLHGHVTRDIGRVAVDDVCQYAGSLGKLHNGRDIGKIVLKGRVKGHVVHRKRVDPSLSTRGYPCRFF